MWSCKSVYCCAHQPSDAAGGQKQAENGEVRKDWVFVICTTVDVGGEKNGIKDDVYIL